MAIQKAIRIVTWGAADGVSTSFTVKLSKDGDPYWVAAQSSGIGGRIANWFADVATNAAPKAATLVSGATSVSLAVPTSMLTVTVPVRPVGTIYTVIVDLLF